MSIIRTITECGQCKIFGAKHLQSLLEPITRRHPFELMVSDTLSMPPGKGGPIGSGGFHKLALEMDTYSQHLWAKPLILPASGETTVTRLRKLWTDFRVPETYMCDNGPEFDNWQLHKLCEEFSVELHFVAEYSPWVNGLVEGTNAKILGRLKRLCAPHLDEDRYNVMGWDDLPSNWPEHLEAAILALNNQILPALKFSPDELLFSVIVNTMPTPIGDAITPVDNTDAGLQMAYMGQLRLDGYAEIMDHAVRRKAQFDKKIMVHAPREVIFKTGSLVQVYNQDFEPGTTFLVKRKMVPMWSAPRRITSQGRNSYKIETLEGLPIGGHISSRHLQQFVLRRGGLMHALQEEWDSGLERS
jgi:hypothetical protein